MVDFFAVEAGCRTEELADGGDEVVEGVYFLWCMFVGKSLRCPADFVVRLG